MMSVAPTSTNTNPFADFFNNLRSNFHYGWRHSPQSSGDGTGTTGGSTGPVTTPVATAPSAVTSLAASAVDNSQIALTWSASASATGYTVEQSIDGITFTTVADLTTTTYTDTGLDSNTTYTYRVTAYNDTGTAAPSATASDTTNADVPVISGGDYYVTGRPSETSTGVDPDVKLTTVSNFTAASNHTYTNLHINGQVTLTDMTNVTFINCIIDAGGKAYDVRCDGASNVTIQSCELVNAGSAGIYGDGFTAIDNFVHQSGGDGFKAGDNVVIAGNYVTDLGWYTPNAHADGVQIRGGTNIRIVGNYFDMPNGVSNTKSNSALFLQLTATNVVFDSNWVLGGNFSIHAYSDTAGGNPTIKITSNVFYSGSTQYGFGSIGSGVVWLSNVTNSGAAALTGMN